MKRKKSIYHLTQKQWKKLLKRKQVTTKQFNDGWVDYYKMKYLAQVKRKPIRRISAARAKRLSEYAKLKRRWLKGKTCQMCPSKKVDVHHSRGRTGRLLCMVEFWIPLCRFHHNKIKEDPAWAYKHELLGPYGSYNSSQK